MRGLRTVEITASAEELPLVAEKVRAATGGEGLTALIDLSEAHSSIASFPRYARAQRWWLTGR